MRLLISISDVIKIPLFTTALPIGNKAVSLPMKRPKYELSSNADFTVFGFVSTGAYGRIPKAIKYTPTLNKDVYNLGFGTIISNNAETGELEIDDTSTNGNADLQMILATVFRSMHAFTEAHPKSYVLFGSSDPAKMRLYRMALSKNYNLVSKTFHLFGAVHNAKGQLVNVPFDLKANVEGFFIKRR
ncbi:hypothetical protein AAEO56_01270 [Flavobacterium sp. DGU11]|uniref:Uncharacterized protein n=1 Tax=Flavobacterium arundinis TaxID=3139143 RepID=A0ABU9HSC7_9FLAO